MNPYWQHDARFRRISEVLWPDDVRLAMGGPCKGRRAADRTMQARYEGFSAWKGLARIAQDISLLVKEAAASLP